MANKKIREYVEQTRAAGYSDAQIKHVLEKAGWSKKEIEECMDISSSHPEKRHHGASNHHSSPRETISLKSLTKKLKIPEKKTIIIFGAGFALVIFALIVVWLLNMSNQSATIQNSCMGSENLECIDASIITKDSVSFVLLNNAGYKIVIDNVESKNKKCAGKPRIILPGSNETDAVNSQIKTNVAFLVKIEGCENGEAGKAYNNDVMIKYINADNLNTVTSVINIIGKVA
jgi:hypothetical protein